MIRQLRAYIVLFLLIVPWCAKGDINVGFSPSRQCENKIVKLIDNSEQTIDIAVYAINNDEIVEHLKKAFDRGVKIRILTDRTQAANKASKVRELYNYGINVKVHSKFKIEHNKFAIFDNLKVSTGSYNWTNPASYKNSENCLFIIKNKTALNEYINRFSYLWRVNSKHKSEDWFTKRK